MIKKFLDNKQTAEEIIDSIELKEAIPELRFKLAIFESQANLVRIKQEFLLSIVENAGYIDQYEFSKLKIAIIGLFSHLKYMIFEKRCFNTCNVQTLKFSDYDAIVFMEEGKHNFSKNEVLHLSDYVLYCLHKLKLTDLLQNLSVDIDSIMKRF